MNLFYPTFATAEGALKEHALANGFYLVIHERYPRGATGEEVQRVNYRCGKGRAAASQPSSSQTHESKKRKHTSRMTSCGYRINLKRVPGSGWRVDTIRTRDGAELTHNHGMFEKSAFHAYRRQNLAKHRDAVMAEWRSGTRKPIKIMKNLREAGADVEFEYQDLANMLQRVRREEGEEVKEEEGKGIEKEEGEGIQEEDEMIQENDGDVAFDDEVSNLEGGEEIQGQDVIVIIDDDDDEDGEDGELPYLNAIKMEKMMKGDAD